MDKPVACHQLALLRQIAGHSGQERETGRRQEREHEAANGAQDKQLPWVGHPCLEQQHDARGEQAEHDK
ncbi:hypothetical protein D3C85_1763890 [compost metagenome]